MSGTKVTSNEVKYENPGVVTKDSLAGESINEGGHFAEGSSARGVLDQPSSSTTTNTTDTSSATKLEPAHSRAERGDETRSHDPAHSRSDRADGIRAHDRAEGFGGAGSPSLNSGAFNKASVPSKTNSASASAPAPKPKGNNLQEGGEITGNEENASFNGHIGDKKDPGRVAVQKILNENNSAGAASGPSQTKLDSNTQYDALGGSTSA